MPTEIQDLMLICAGVGAFAAVDYYVVKFNAWRDRKKPKPRGATAL